MAKKIVFCEFGKEQWNKLFSIGKKSDSSSEEISTEWCVGGFVCIENDLVLGRIVCYKNPFHIVEGSVVLTLGHIEFIYDIKVFNMLMDAVVSLALNLGIEKIIGPMNGSTWNDYRFVIGEQKEPFLLEPVTKPHYVEFFKSWGFKTLSKYHSAMANKVDPIWERVRNRYEEFLKKGVVFRSFDKDSAKIEFSKLAIFCNEAFSKNYLFSPISEKNFTSRMMRSLPLIEEDYTILAEKEGGLVGFIFTYPDLLNPHEKILVIKTIARKPGRDYLGMGSVLTSLVLRQAENDKFQKVIHALILDSNISKNLSEKFDGSIIRQYELLQFDIKT